MYISRTGAWLYLRLTAGPEPGDAQENRSGWAHDVPLAGSAICALSAARSPATINSASELITCD